MKITSSDIATILRTYNQALPDITPRFVKYIQHSHPLEHNERITFRYLKHDWAILVDSTAEDDSAYILEQATQAGEDTSDMLVVPNPKETSSMTYGLPYKGKDIYLVRKTALLQRLDTELSQRFPETSRTTWQKLIKAGHVRVNGSVTLQPKHPIDTDDDIVVERPDETDYAAETLPVIYSDDDVVTINKPTGVLTHSKGALNDEFTVAEFFRRYSTWHSDTNRPGIVHRLDRDTSGVMIGARHEAVGKSLQKQFSERTVKKTYIAVVEGHLDAPEALIDLPIDRNPSAPSTFRVDPNGKSAETAYRVLAVNDTHSLVELRPKTGRTHQLRVHLAYLGHPIRGDRVYGTADDRLYLHAASLEVTLPGGNRHVFEAPVPPVFTEPFDAI